jgi:cobalt-zinc-cadmium efflux system membrane fusion protein
MTELQNITPEKVSEKGRDSLRSGRIWSPRTIALSLLATSGGLVLLWWFFQGTPSTALQAEPAGNTRQAVHLVGPRLIAVMPESPLEQRLTVESVMSEQISTPVLTVTGAIVARLPRGNGPAEDRWQFSRAELLSAYADWQKAAVEVEFVEKQLATLRELTTAQVTAQRNVVERLRKLTAAGTDSPRDLAAEEANLLQLRLQSQKDVFEAEAAVKAAQRSRAALERQLFQAGVDPSLLGRSPEGTVIVVADVPEARISLVHEGQACEAHFYGVPQQVFPGRVGSLAPTLSPEHRTLRVLFQLRDPDGHLKPGMFAEIGLGTEQRTAIFAPIDGVLHVGRSDYVLVETEPGRWQVTEVKVGELNEERVEILAGVHAGNRIIGSGAILLKPLVVQALRQ